MVKKIVSGAHRGNQRRFVSAFVGLLCFYCATPRKRSEVRSQYTRAESDTCLVLFSSSSHTLEWLPFLKGSEGVGRLTQKTNTIYMLYNRPCIIQDNVVNQWFSIFSTRKCKIKTVDISWCCIFVTFIHCKGCMYCKYNMNRCIERIMPFLYSSVSNLNLSLIFVLDMKHWM